MEEKLERIAEWSVGLEISGTAVRSAAEARKIHIADSLAGLEVPAIREAGVVIDIGSGAGFPGLVLAIALPQTQFVLADSVRKKMESAAALARELELANVECVWGRVEQLAEVGSPHRDRYDVVTARALAQLGVLLEYAAPLLKLGGELVSWKGAPSTQELTTAASAAEQLGMSELTQHETQPFVDSRRRHFFTSRKLAETPERFPRRPGIALKRPLV